MTRIKLNEIYSGLVQKGFFDSDKKRLFLEKIFERLEDDVNKRRNVIIRAPPGIGKTTITHVLFLNTLINEDITYMDVIHVVPTRSLIEDLWRRSVNRFSRILNLSNIDPESLVKRNIVRLYSGVHETSFLIGSLIFTTYDTYYYNIIKIPPQETRKIVSDISYGHYEIPRAAIHYSANIFDEIHLVLEEGGQSTQAYSSIIEYLAKTRTLLILLTATLPSKILARIKENLGNFGIDIDIIDYSSEEYKHIVKEDEFYTRESSKNFERLEKPLIDLNNNNYQELIDTIAGLWNKDLSRGNSPRIAIICNTISRAKKIFRLLRDRLGKNNVILLTSRFTRRDREKKLEEIETRNRIILVSTQVIEVGVDMNFNVLISEIAPPSSLVQRFGRLARGDNSFGEWGLFYDNDTLKGSGIYDPELTSCSHKYIENVIRSNLSINWHLPHVFDQANIMGYSEIIEKCWENRDINLSANIYTLEILSNPMISSKDSVYLQNAITFREENLCTLYIGTEEYPENIHDYYESLDNKAINIACNELINYIDKILRERSNIDIYALIYKRDDNKVYNKKIDRDTLREISKIFKDPVKYMKHLGANEIYLSIAIPEDLYDGGIYGEGLKDL